MENILCRTLEQLAEVYGALKHALIHLECSDDCQALFKDSRPKASVIVLELHLLPSVFEVRQSRMASYI